jgi:hypothetical protein
VVVRVGVEGRAEAMSGQVGGARCSTPSR